MKDTKKTLEKTIGTEIFFSGLEYLPLPCQSLDINGKIIYVNNLWCESLGYSRDEVEGKWFGDILLLDFIPVFKTRFQEFKQSGIVRNAKFWLKKKDGSHIYVSYDGNAQYDEEGLFERSVCLFRDITNEKEEGDALSERKERYKAILLNIEELVCELDENGIYTYLSPQYEPGLGYKPEELLGRPAIDLIHPDDLKKAIDKYADLIDAEDVSVDYWRFLHKEGYYRTFECKGKVYTDSSGNTRTVVISRDITELERDRERLERAEKVAQSGNWEINLRTRMVYASKGAHEVYGIMEEPVTLDAIQNIPLPEFRADLDSALRNLITRNIPYDVHFKIRRATDQKLIDIHSVAEYDKEKNVIYGIIQDVTTFKDIENELLMAKEKAEESDRLKSSFLANMSHEIRTPMNAILGFSELLSSNDLGLDQRAYYSNIVIDCSHQLLGLVNDILDISKIETGQMTVFKKNFELVNLFVEVESVFEKKALDKGIVFEFRRTEEKQVILCSDEKKVRQILINLVSNSLKFTNEGYVYFGFELRDNLVYCFVRDSGIGIEPENQAKIFDRFHQVDNSGNNSARGTGLGLAISKSFCQLMGGEIGVDSTPGKGSEFWFTLPL